MSRRSQFINTDDATKAVPVPHSSITHDDSADLQRIEGAMRKIAYAMPFNPKLEPVWSRLQDLWEQIRAGHAKETDAQRSVRAWLIDQNEISSSSAAVCDNDNPEP